MGRRDDARKARILAGLELPTAKKRDAQDAIPCTGCGTPIPKRVLREGHGEMGWCGTMSLGSSDNLVLCPDCVKACSAGTKLEGN